MTTTGDDVTSYSSVGLDPEETYFYRVLVILEDGVSAPPSDVVSATTPVDPPGATVLQVTATSRTTIDLAWDDVAAESSFRIERSADGETEWTAIGTTGQDVTTYTDPGSCRTRRTSTVSLQRTREALRTVERGRRDDEEGAGTGGEFDGDGTGDGEPAVDDDATSPMIELGIIQDLAATADEVEPSGELAG